MALFDQESPGHHLRLTNRVRTSVVALVPPDHGFGLDAQPELLMPFEYLVFADQANRLPVQATPRLAAVVSLRRSGAGAQLLGPHTPEGPV